VRIPFCTQSYRLDALPVSSQRCVNLIPESAPPDARTQAYLYGSPGLLEFVEIPAIEIRGLRVMGDYLFAVVGGTLYRISEAGTLLLLGAISGAGPVTMADNGTQLAIVSSTGGGYIATTTTLNVITDPDFPSVSSVDYVDGYFVFTVTDSDQFIISGILDGTAYDALDFASSEGFPDRLVRVLVDHREVWFFNEKSTEIWVSTGASSFPFQRQDGTFIERGCAAKFSPAKMDNSVFWLGDDKIVYRANGYQPARISTHAIERSIEKFDTISDAIGWTYTQHGHSFYVLTFPDADQTFVFDAATGLWHERKSGTEDFARWRINTGVAAFGKVIVGDSGTGKLFYLDPETYSEDGSTLQRVAMSSPIAVENKWVQMASLEIEFDVGVGSDASCWLSWSDDGGRTFSNEYDRTLGAIGEYRTRVRWKRLGQFRQRMFKLTYSNATPFNLIAANADVVKLAA
jgi:hypothetical protein